MENKKTKTSCWVNNENSTGTVEKVYVCPVCYGETQEVKSITVKHFVFDSFVDEVQDSKYHICLNKDCDVIYFNSDQRLVFKKDSIKIPIWFKRDANPKCICYCNQVTEQQIIDAVLNENAKDMKDVIRITGAMKNGKCEIKNPLGKCCGSAIQETIKKALEIKNFKQK